MVCELGILSALAFVLVWYGLRPSSLLFRVWPTSILNRSAFVLVVVLALGVWFWITGSDRRKIEAFIAKYHLDAERTNDSWRTYHNFDAQLLFIAAHTGDVAVAKILLAHTTNVNVRCYLSTPLHQAAWKGHADIVKLLLAHKAKLDVRDHQGDRPLALASNKAVAELLLTDETDADERFRALWNAAGHGHKDVVEFLLARKVPVNGEGWDGSPPLYAAAHGGHKDIVQLLLAHGAEVNPTNRHGGSPLGGAAYGGNKEIVELLLAKGAQVNSESEDGTPLENAIYGCYTNWDFSDRCSVSAASRRAVVELLLDHGAEVNYTNGIHMGRGTPLGSAAGSGQKWLVELLLARGAQVNVRDFYGRTPLMLAVERGYKDIVELLQAHNAEDTLFDAARVGDVETVKSLLDKNSELIRSSDENGKTALHYAARFGKKDIVELLLANKADINAKNKDGRTPLHQAAERSDGNLIELLLAHKAEINVRDANGVMPWTS
ncbi:MAG: ankyrin repeat domain-containing protein, partial [Verrucomicrobiota bacterium]